MPWKPIAYALLCVAVPLVWGLAVYWVSTRIERRVLRKPSQHSGEGGDSLPLDYHI